MTVELLLAAGVILVCLLASKFSAKLGVPTLLVFIFLGMVFGSDGVFKIQFDNYSVAEQICSIALIFIMFYGGFGTNWQKAKTVAVKAVMLSTVGVLLTAAITGIFCHFVFLRFLEHPARSLVLLHECCNDWLHFLLLNGDDCLLLFGLTETAIWSYISSL